MTGSIEPVDEEIARLAEQLGVQRPDVPAFARVVSALMESTTISAAQAADAVAKTLPLLVPARWVLPAGDVDDQALLDAATASPGHLWVIPEPAVVDTEIASLEHAVIESALALHEVRGASADTVLEASRTHYRNTIALAEALKETSNDDDR